MLLAEASNSQLGLWVQCANIFVTLIIGLTVLLKFARNDSEKRDVTINPHTATKEEFTALVNRNAKDHDDLHSRIGGSERGTRTIIDNKISELRQEQAATIQNLNNEVVTLANEVGKISAQNELQNQRLIQMDSKLDRLVEKRKV